MYLPRIVEHLHAQAQQRQLELEGVQLSRGGCRANVSVAPSSRNRPHCRVAKKKRCVLMHDHSPAPPPEGGPHRGQLQQANPGEGKARRWKAPTTYELRPTALHSDHQKKRHRPRLGRGPPFGRLPRAFFVAARGGDLPLVVAQVSDRV